MNKTNATEEKVWHFIEPLLAETPYEIYDITFLKEGSEWYLRIYIDKAEGVDLNDCEAVTDLVNDPLDELDPIRDPYFLEVSSPGVERHLRLMEHFQKALGEKVALKLFAKIENSKEWVGVLTSADEENITLEVKGKQISFPCDMIAKASISVF